MKEEEYQELIEQFEHDLVAIYMSHTTGGELVQRSISLLKLYLGKFIKK